MNITKGEEAAIRELMHDDSIVIRPADKGSGIVILNTEDYSATIEKELKDSTTYLETDNDRTKDVHNSIKRLVDSMYKRGLIQKEMCNYLKPVDTRSGKVQGNPKLHKQNIPYRIIVNGRNHPTEKLAEIVEQELKPHVKSLPSFVQDTTDFLKKIKEKDGQIPENSILFCMDVKALYPSIPRQEARTAVQNVLNKRKDPSITTAGILEMMDAVLDKNTFEFNGKYYKQTEGTAIGSKLGMCYASTYLGEWEKELFERSDKHPMIYYRYVDDIWGVWTYSEEELVRFHYIANSINPRIKLELRLSRQQIEFLDVITMIDGDKIATDVYSKESDKHLYLNVKSEHPTSVKNCIAYGLGIRAKRICSDDKNFEKQKLHIKNHLKRRGYKAHTINKQLRKVDNLDRQQLFQYSSKKRENTVMKGDRVPLVLTYSRALPNIKKILKKHETILHRSERMRSIFREPSLISYRRDKSIQDILVHKKHNKIFFQAANKCEKCGRDCALCSKIIESDVFSDTKNKKYTVKGYITCKTENLIYAVFCVKCNKYLYVGETGGTLYQRMLLNFSRIRTKYNDPMCQHFFNDGHTIDDFKVIGIEKIYKGVTYRQTKERLWKKKMNTYKPNGLNTCE